MKSVEKLTVVAGKQDESSLSSLDQEEDCGKGKLELCKGQSCVAQVKDRNVNE